MQASIFILKVVPGRRDILLGALEDDSMFRGHGRGTEPVTAFDHKRKVPLIVLGCFEDGKITHIADGRKGANAGTDLVRLNMQNLEVLKKPIELSALIDGAEPRIRAHLKRISMDGGKLPPKCLGSVVDTILKLDPSLSNRLERFSESRGKKIAAFTEKERDNLALQKESLGMALEISGIGTEDLLTWKPDKKDELFLDGYRASVYVKMLC